MTTHSDPNHTSISLSPDILKKYDLVVGFNTKRPETELNKLMDIQMETVVLVDPDKLLTYIENLEERIDNLDKNLLKLSLKFSEVLRNSEGKDTLDRTSTSAIYSQLPSPP